MNAVPGSPDPGPAGPPASIAGGAGAAPGAPLRPGRPRGRRRWVWVLLAVLVVPPALAGLAVWSVVRGASEVRAVRAGVERAVAQDLPRTVELRAGPLLLGLVRAGCTVAGACAGEEVLPAAVHPALRAVRRASVGVYEVGDDAAAAIRGALLAAAGAALPAGDGWERIVTVQERGGDTVGVYLRPHDAGLHELDLVVVVLEGDGDEMVVASLRLRPEHLAPLVALLREQHG